MFGGLISWRAFSGGIRRRDLAGGGCARLIALPPPAIPHDDGDLADGVWPEDLDLEPAWVTRQLARSDKRGLIVPQIRTRRDLEDAIERCRVALASPEIQIETIPETMLPEHTGSEAAQLFLAHLRATVSEPQRFSSDGLAAAYASWCAADQRRAPTPENTMRGALKQLPGISRDQVSTMVDGRRVRSFVWTVSPAETVAKPSIAPEMEAAA